MLIKRSFQSAINRYAGIKRREKRKEEKRRLRLSFLGEPQALMKRDGDAGISMRTC